MDINERVNGYMLTIRAELNEKMRDVDNLSLDIIEHHLRRWLMAEAKVAELGIVLPSDRGNMSKNPAIDVALASLRQAVGLMQDYGLTALSDKKLQRGEPKEGAKSPFAEFLDDDE